MRAWCWELMIKWRDFEAFHCVWIDAAEDRSSRRLAKLQCACISPEPFPRRHSWASTVRRSIQCVKISFRVLCAFPLRRWSELEELAGALGTLAGVQVGGLGLGEGIWGLLDDFLGLGEDELDVAWVGHVWVDLWSG